MKIGIISDTHDRHEKVLKAVQVFNDEGIDYVLHAGDMTLPSTAKLFAGLQGHFVGVFGNCCRDRIFLADTIGSFGGEIYDSVYTGEINGKRIYMMHQPVMLDEVIDSGNYDLVIHGHTHKFDARRFGDAVLINPGQSAVIIMDLGDMTFEKLAL